MTTVATAVLGASGYGGQELIRYLARHPAFKLVAVTSRQSAGQPLSSLVDGLPKDVGSICFTDASLESGLLDQAELFFLALPHGTAAPFATVLRKAGKRVVDLSADFRTTDPAVYKEFYDHDHPAPELLGEAVYGLPEVHRERLKQSQLVAAPGCFPTSIILPLVPFLKAGLIDPETVVVNSISGVSGAGRKLEMRLLFGEVAENFHAYGVPKHRHIGEVEQELSLAAGKAVRITFIPHLVPVHRGMISTTTAKLTRDLPRHGAEAVLREAYGSEPFVEVLAAGQVPQSRSVLRSNRIQVSAEVDVRTNRLMLFSAIDNLGKGNATQGIQCANLMFGFQETLGLL